MADRRVLVACSLYHLTNDAGIAVIPALLPILTGTLDFGPAEVGVLTAVGLLVTFAFQIVFGALSDRVGRRALLSFGIAWFGLGMMALALAPSFGVLLLFVAITRVGASVYHPVGISWVSREFGGPDVDRAMGIQGSFGDLGVLLGLFPAGFLVLAVGWQGVFLFWGAVNVTAAVAGFWITANVMKAPPAPFKSQSRRASLGGIVAWAFPLAAGGAAFTITITFGPLLLTGGLRTSPEVADLVVGAWIAVGSLAAFRFGRISQGIGRFRALQYAFLSIAVGAVMVAAAPSVWVVLLGLVGFCSVLFVTYPALFAFISDIADFRAQGLLYGEIFGFQLAGGSAASLAAGWLWAATSRPEIPFYLLAAIALATFAYLFVLRAVREDRTSVGGA